MRMNANDNRTIQTPIDDKLHRITAAFRGDLVAHHGPIGVVFKIAHGNKSTPIENSPPVLRQHMETQATNMMIRYAEGYRSPVLENQAEVPQAGFKLHTVG